MNRKWATRTLPITNTNPLVVQIFQMLDASDMSQEELAKKVGTDQGTISNWRRKSNPTLVLLAAAAEALGGSLVILTMDNPPRGAADLVRKALR